MIFGQANSAVTQPSMRWQDDDKKLTLHRDTEQVTEKGRKK